MKGFKKRDVRARITRTGMCVRMPALVAAVSVVLGAALFASCAGFTKAPSRPKQATELLDWKNAGLGTPVPDWVMQSAQNDIQVQKIAEFKGQTAFVVTRENENKDLATTWANNSANGAAEVSRIISTTVNNGANATESMKTGDERLKQFSDEIRNTMSNASFKGLRRTSDFWTFNKNRATKKEYYTAYSLWLIEDKELQQQLAANYQNIIDNNKAMSAEERKIYSDIIKGVLARGLTNIESGAR